MKQTSLIISNDNPFKTQIESRLQESNTRTLLSEEYTLKVKRTYLPIGFAKLYQDKNLLAGLTPDACKILVVMALSMEYNSDQIRLAQRESGLTKRRYHRAIMELMLAGVIAKVANKRELYWINVALIVVGKVDKER